MFKVISAIFTAGIIVGAALVIRGRSSIDPSEREVAQVDHSDPGDTTERQVPVVSAPKGAQ